MTNIYQNQKSSFQVQSSWGAASARHCAGFPSSSRRNAQEGSSHCYEVPLGPSIVVWDVVKGERKTFFQAHNDLITVMLYNPVYDLVITVSYSGELKVWDADWQMLFSMDSGLSKLQDGRLSKDDNYLSLTSVGDDSALALYHITCEETMSSIRLTLCWKTEAKIFSDSSAEARTNSQSSTFAQYSDSFDCALFNPSGKILAFFCKKDSSSDVILFSSDGKKEMQCPLEPLGEKASAIMCVSECKHGVFAVGFQGGIFMLLNCESLDTVGVFQATGSPQAVTWDGDNLLAVSYLSGIMSWWDTQGQLMHEVRQGPTDSIINVQWGTGSALWVAGIMSLHYVEFDYGTSVEGDAPSVKSGTSINESDEAKHGVKRRKLSVNSSAVGMNKQSSTSDGRTGDDIISQERSAEEKNTEKRRYPRTLTVSHSLSFHQVTGCGVDLTPTNQIVSGDFTGTINVWDRGNVHPSHSANIQSSVRCLTCRYNEVFIGTLEGCIFKWDIGQEGAFPEECLYPPGGVLNMKWSQTWTHLALGVTTGYLEVYQYKSHGQFDCALSVLAHQGADDGIAMEVWSVAWSPCHQMIATASEDHTACIWDLKGVKQHTLRGHTTAVTAVDWQTMSSGMNMLVTCADDRTVRVYDGTRFSLVTVLDSKDIHGWHTLTYLCLNPDTGQCLCSTQNGHLVLWNVPSGERVACWKVHCGSIEGLVWRRDLIGTVSSDCVVNLFKVKSLDSIS